MGELTVHLREGPFDGERRKLLSPTPGLEPPGEVTVYRCPCCAQAAVLLEDDPRCARVEEIGGEPHRYRFKMGLPDGTPSGSAAIYVYDGEGRSSGLAIEDLVGAGVPA